MLGGGKGVVSAAVGSVETSGADGREGSGSGEDEVGG